MGLKYLTSYSMYLFIYFIIMKPEIDLTFIPFKYKTATVG